MAAGLNAGVAFIDILPNMAKFSASLTSGMKKAGESMASTGRMLTHTLTIPIGLAAAASVKMSIDFQRAMEQVHTQAGASQAEVNKLNDRVLELAKSTSQGPEELANALFHIESVGFRGAKAMDVLKTATKGAAVGGADLEDTASALAAVTLTNIKGTQDYDHAMGVLNATIGAGNMRMGDLLEALKSGIVPTAKVAGLSLTGLTSALAMMTDEGVPAGVAANRLRTALLMMTNPTVKAQHALKTIGLSALDLGHELQKPDGLVKALTLLRDHMQKIQDPTKRLALIGDLFGGSRSAGTIALLFNNLDRVEMKYQQINKTAGHFNEDVAATQKTALFKLQAAWSSVQVAMIKTGSILMPIVVDLANDFASLANAFGNLNPGVQKWIVYSGLMLAVLGPLLSVIGNLVVVTTTLGTGLVFMGTGLVKLLALLPGLSVELVAGEGAMIAFGESFTLALGPIGLAAAALVTVGVAAVALYGAFSNSSTVTDQLAGAAKRATDAVNGLNTSMNKSEDAQHAANEAHTQARAAYLALAQQQQNVNKLQKEGKTHTLEYKIAVNQLAQAKENAFDADERAAEAQQKANRLQNQAAQTYRRQRTAIVELTNSYRKKIAADQKNARNVAISLGPERARQQLMKQTQVNVEAYAKHMMDLSGAYSHQASVARSNGDPALASTERHMSAVARAAAEVAKRINGIPSSKQVSIQVAIDAIVHQVVGAGPHGYAGNPHAGHGGPHRAAGGPVRAGVPYIVGEVGPELFVPSVSGTIVPNSALGAAGDTRRAHIRITNWHEGTGIMEEMADGSVDASARLHRQRGRMSR